MPAGAANFPESGRAGAWRLVATWMVLLAFALQSYVTQTHIHPAPFAADRAPIAQVVGAVSVQVASPLDEAVACPFCQAIAAAGALHGPVAVAIDRLVFATLAAHGPPTVAGRATQPAGFSWRSRAPPHA